jgi:hypothetical protein
VSSQQGDDSNGLHKIKSLEVSIVIHRVFSVEDMSTDRM